MDEAVIKVKVDELAKWSRLAEECKREIDTLKGEFDKLGQEALADKKIKQVEFWGNNNAKVVVTESEELKVQYDCILEQLFSKVKDGSIKIEPKYQYSAPFKRILISIFQGTYLDQHLNDVIRQIPADDSAKKVLRKKLKGKWDKDVETLQSIANLSQSDSEYYAYQVQESMNFEKIIALFKSAGYVPGTSEFGQAIDSIRAAVIVETGLKIGVESAEAAC
jgi:uncharacterized FlaG/YvyC family protein